MTEHNQKLEPSQFDLNTGAAPASTATTPGSARQGAPTGGGDSQRTTVIALAGLLLVAGLVFFWLPSRVAPPEIETGSSEAASAPSRARPAAESADAPSPFADHAWAIHG